MKPSNSYYYVGIDVCKANLDVFCPGWTVCESVLNEPKAIRALLRRLRRLSGRPHLVCEATGGYEKDLVKECFRLEMPISVINARQPRDYARSKGLLAKTDAIDARILAEFGEVHRPAALAATSGTQEALSAVVRRRELLVRNRASEQVLLDKVRDRFVKAELRTSIAQLSRRITKCDQRIRELIDTDPDLKAKRRRLEELKGAGPTLSALLLAEVPELGTISDKEISALVGVAPFNRDSGRWRGQRTISGGRGLVRRGLYMPALCAVTHNPVLAEFYQGLIARHKPHHVALTAVMRKMICVLNRLLADPDFQLS